MILNFNYSQKPTERQKTEYWASVQKKLLTKWMMEPPPPHTPPLRTPPCWSAAIEWPTDYYEKKIFLLQTYTTTREGVSKVVKRVLNEWQSCYSRKSNYRFWTLTSEHTCMYNLSSLIDTPRKGHWNWKISTMYMPQSEYNWTTWRESWQE